MAQFNCWIFLLAIRFLFLFGTGYIHPDEHFQNPQILAQLMYPHLYLSHWTWEWQSSFPIRSIIGPLLNSGILFYLLGEMPASVFGRLFLSRLGPFLWSLVVDLVIIQSSLLLDCNGSVDMLFFYASSWTTIILGCRPFMNSFISVVYVLSIACIYLVHKKHRLCTAIAFILGLLVAIGLWSHSSFVIYSIPIWIGFMIFCSFESAVPFLGGLSLAASVFYLVDCFFYNDGNLMFPMIVNNILYNSSEHNLSQHGIHPKYLHIVVNMFILFGPAYLLLLMNFSILARTKKLLLTSFLIPLFSLSAIPHQEPRFLAPLSVPLLFLTSCCPASRKRGFLVCWIVFNALMCLLFGVFHQRGVIIGLDLARKFQAKQVIAYAVYMPPNYLLPTDVALTANPSSEYLSSLEFERPALVVIPELILHKLNFSSLSSLELIKTVYHFDFDLLPQFGYTCNIYLLR